MSGSLGLPASVRDLGPILFSLLQQHGVLELGYIDRIDTATGLYAKGRARTSCR